MSAQPNHDNSSTPRAAQGSSMPLLASAVLSAAGAWTRSNIVSVEGAREIVLFVDYTADASGGTDGYPEILPLVSIEQTQPAAGDATWAAPGVWDGTVTEGTLAGTLPAGSDFTATPNFGKTKHLPLILRLDPVDADTDRIQVMIRINVAPYRWLQLAVHEAGDTANPGTLAIAYALAC